MNAMKKDSIIFTSFHELDSLSYSEGKNLSLCSSFSTKKIKISNDFNIKIENQVIYFIPSYVGHITPTLTKISQTYFKLKELFNSIRFGFVHGVRLLGRGYKVFKYLNGYSFRIGYCHQVNVLVPFIFKNQSKLKLKNFWKIKSLDNRQLSNLVNFIQTLKVPNAYRYKGIYIFDQKYNIKAVKKSL